MKRFLFFAVTVIFSMSLFAKDIQQLVVTTNPPMHCQNCENKIKKGELRFVKGIKKIETDIPEQRVTIEYDADVTNPEKIENAFHKIGYQVEVICPESNCDSENKDNCNKTPETGSACSGACCQAKTR